MNILRKYALQLRLCQNNLKWHYVYACVAAKFFISFSYNSKLSLKWTSYVLGGWNILFNSETFSHAHLFKFESCTLAHNCLEFWYFSNTKASISFKLCLQLPKFCISFSGYTMTRDASQSILYFPKEQSITF